MNNMKDRLNDFIRDALRFPWRNTAVTLRERFKEDQLGLTASSLTFTTIISIVPLLTVALAIFSVFPMFAKMQTSIQLWLVDSLIPDNIAKQVLNYVGMFAAKAKQIGWVGAAAFLVSALLLILTIDRRLNNIWRVRETRSLTKRILIYWALLTLGPLLLGASLSLSSYALSSTKGWVNGAGMTDGFKLFIDALQFIALTLVLAAMYKFVPNTQVRWPHALLGAVFAALGIELAQRILAWYLVKVPTMSAVYGAFATVPILLIWVYVAWVIVLLGAVVAAYLPSLLSGIARRDDSPGWDFQLALELLRQLQPQDSAAAKPAKNLDELSKDLRVNDLQLERALQTLLSLDWIGKLEEDQGRSKGRYVLLVNPISTPLAPLAEKLLLPHNEHTQNLWQKWQLSACLLPEVL
ncbi:MAG TPA: YihY family inner membrane protein [Burkholderiaceae bacterium]|nr:YihY family inner membrane protein [Burkholderiaceae bacterium]